MFTEALYKIKVKLKSRKGRTIINGAYFGAEIKNGFVMEICLDELINSITKQTLNESPSVWVTDTKRNISSRTSRSSYLVLKSQYSPILD